MSIEYRSHRIKALNYEIDALVEKRKYLYELVTKITPAYKDIHVRESTVDSSKIDTYVTQMANISTIVNQKLDEIDRLRYELDRDINAINDERMRLLLQLRYLYYRSWGYISKRVDFTESYVKNKFHKKCLEEFKKESTKSTK